MTIQVEVDPPIPTEPTVTNSGIPLKTAHYLRHLLGTLCGSWPAEMSYASGAENIYQELEEAIGKDYHVPTFVIHPNSSDDYLFLNIAGK
jgi:hypothetical protein